MSTTTKRARFSETALAKALSTAREAGLSVSRALITRAGDIDLQFGPVEPVDLFEETDMRR